jgi:hypothetical protein
MLASSTLSHLTLAIPDQAPHRRLFETIRALAKVASYCDDIANDNLQKCRFIIERLHRLHFPGETYKNDLDTSQVILKVRMDDLQPGSTCNVRRGRGFHGSRVWLIVWLLGRRFAPPH